MMKDPELATRGPVLLGESTEDRSRRRRWVDKIVVLTILAFGGMYFLSFSTPRPNSLGVVDGQLAACPDSPNCVSSQSSDPRHAMDPIPVPQNEADMIGRIARVIAAQPRTRIVTQNDRYLHAEFTSFLFRFVDDVEFFLDDSQQVVHFRSASRVGYSDLGANRKRMARLRELISNEQISDE